MQRHERQERPDEADEDESMALSGITWFCCGADAPVRRTCRNLLLSETWKGLVVVVILVSCVCIAFDNPRIDRSSTLAHQLRWADYMITVFFAFEAMAKMLVGGVLCGRNAYFSSRYSTPRLQTLCLAGCTLRLQSSAWPVGVRCSSIVPSIPHVLQVELP